MAKIYVASSWRNSYFPVVVKKLREFGHEVYDFRNPPHNHGTFMWKYIDPEFENWNVKDYKKGLKNFSDVAQSGQACSSSKKKRAISLSK